MDLWTWDKNILFNDNYNFAGFTDSNTNYQYKFKIFSNKYECTITDLNSDKIILFFTDILYNSSSLGSFTRVFKDKNNFKQIFIEGEYQGEEYNLDSLYIKKNTQADQFFSKFAASDIETHGNPMSLASISVYSKEASKSWFILDYPNAE